MRLLVEVIRKRRWLPALVWGTAILAVSSLPHLSLTEKKLIGCDKILHFIEYSILGIALRYWAGQGRRCFLPGGVVFAAFDEFHQAFVPGRHASPWDFAADAGGVIVGFLVAGRWVRRGQE